MRILIAEDDPVSRRLLEMTLRKWGYEVTVTCDGREALTELEGENAPRLAIIDWMMPGMDGIEVCQKVRLLPNPVPTYLIFLTARGNKEDIVAGLSAGADDYVAKPFNRAELHARLQVGERIIELQRKLSQRVKELEEALRHVKKLQGMLPICSYCKKVRDDKNYWQQVEEYVTERSDAIFSHSVCPECAEKHLKPEIEELARSLEPAE